MAAKRARKPSGARPGRRNPAKRASPRTSQLSVRPLGDGAEGYELVHPRCARQRAEDLEEVYAMLEAEEFEVARDELRWLLDDCGEFVEAHRLLGELALTDGDVPLAIGHFRYAYQLGEQALPGPSWTGPLPAEAAGNAAFFEAGRGYAECLLQQNQRREAMDVLKRLIALDPTDPLELAPVLRQSQTGLMILPAAPEPPANQTPAPPQERPHA